MSVMPRDPSPAASPRSPRSAVAAIAVSAVAVAFAGLAAYVVWDAAVITYQLPPGPGTPDPNIHQDLNVRALVGLAPIVPGVLLALCGIALGIRGLRRRDSRWRVVLFPVAAVLLAALGPVLALMVETPTY